MVLTCPPCCWPWFCPDLHLLFRPLELLACSLLDPACITPQTVALGPSQMPLGVFSALVFAFLVLDSSSKSCVGPLWCADPWVALLVMVHHSTWNSSPCLEASSSLLEPLSNQSSPALVLCYLPISRSEVRCMGRWWFLFLLFIRHKWRRNLPPTLATISCTPRGKQGYQFLREAIELPLILRAITTRSHSGNCVFRDRMRATSLPVPLVQQEENWPPSVLDHNSQASHNPSMNPFRFPLALSCAPAHLIPVQNPHVMLWNMTEL